MVAFSGEQPSPQVLNGVVPVCLGKEEYQEGGWNRAGEEEEKDSQR